MTKVRFLLADDSPEIRYLERVLVSQIDGCEVVAEADNGRDAVAVARSSKVDVILMDFYMPFLDGVQATREIVSAYPRVRVVAFTGAGGRAQIQQFLAAGASTHIDKSDPTVLLEKLKILVGDLLADPSSA